MHVPGASLLFAVLTVVGCGDDGSSPRADAGPPDAPIDAYRPPRVDSGPPDAGPRVDLCDPGAMPGPYPAPGSWGPNRGPGGPARSFADGELYTQCTYLDGGEGDTTDHHNLVTMFDGYLMMPWAPEFGRGGLTFFDVRDPCAPVMAGYGTAMDMRETHSVGFSQLGGRWAVVDQMTNVAMLGGGGILFWDLSDTSAPEPAGRITFRDFVYPDAYARVTLSVFWQAPYVYVGGADNGIYVVDAADPRAPVLVAQVPIEPTLRVGQVQVIGNLLIATPAEGPRTVLLDVSDPERPQPIPGGDFETEDAEGLLVESYFSNFANGIVYYARKSDGGGLTAYDITDPTRPVFAGSVRSEGNGGYVFLHHGFAFEGESSFATIYDVSDLSAMSMVQRLDLEGDLDTASPIGNVVVLSVDDDAIDDQGSSIVPWQREPDAQAPRVTFVWPPDGATDLPLTSRFGVGFDEAIDSRSAFEGSVRLYRTGMDPDATRVAGTVSAQEVIANFHPFCPLAPSTSYTLEISAGGVVDFNGNAVAETFTATFTTAAE